MALKNKELEIRVKVRVCPVILSHDYRMIEPCFNQASEENAESLTEECEKLEASESSLKEELNVSELVGHAIVST